MQFNSYIFILLFLPMVCMGYYWIIKIKKQEWLNLFLLFMSLGFYVYAGKESLLLLLGDIIVNFLFYKAIQNNINRINKKKILLIFAVSFNLLILFYFKYVNFFISNANLFLKKEYTIIDVIQPLGISFLVFQQIAFLVDTSRDEVEKCSFVEYALFTSYFPHISSGPIMLHNDILVDLKAKKFVDWHKISCGIYMFVMGLGKKVLIADLLSKAVDWGYANISELNTSSVLFISVAYSLQIYFDFSGYSDMAIGISRILQLDLPMNFNSPYKSKNILDFWSRWHMTLTRFLTKYLYIPLGGNRKGKLRTYVNTFIVFMCSGIWHGASWTFVLWGLLHGSFMILTKYFKTSIDRIPDFINKMITLLFINFTWIVFRAGSFSTLRQLLNSLILGGWGVLHEEIASIFKGFGILEFDIINIPNWCWALGTIIALIYVVLGMKNVEEKVKEMKFDVWSCIGTVFVTFMCIISFSGVSTFIYSMF